MIKCGNLYFTGIPIEGKLRSLGIKSFFAQKIIIGQR